MTADAILTKRRRRGEAARRMHSEMELWAPPSLQTSADRNNNSSRLGARPKYFSYNILSFPCALILFPLTGEPLQPRVGPIPLIPLCLTR